MTAHHTPFTLEEVTDPAVGIHAQAQRARFERNAAWLQAHAAEIYPRYRGKHICIAGETLFVGETPDEAWTLATAAHPDDDGRFLYYIPREPLARVYVH
jgi:hypothetical protein